MRTLLRLTALAVLSLSSLSLYAASGDAVAVLQECGAPGTDTFVHDAASAFPEQRLLTYGEISLYFNQEKEGWSFLEAKRGHSPLDRARIDQLLPCFHDAMQSVPLYTPLQVSASEPSAQPATLSERLFSRIHPSRSMWGLLALLYLLPAIIGWIRTPIHRNLLIMIDLLFGWTILGWVVALVLACGENADSESRRRFIEGEEGHVSFTAPASAFLDDASADNSRNDRSDRSRSDRPQVAISKTDKTKVYEPIVYETNACEPSVYEPGVYEPHADREPLYQATSGPAWNDTAPAWNRSTEVLRTSSSRSVAAEPISKMPEPGVNVSEPISFEGHRKLIIDPLPAVSEPKSLAIESSYADRIVDKPVLDKPIVDAPMNAEQKPASPTHVVSKQSRAVMPLPSKSSQLDLEPLEPREHRGISFAQISPSEAEAEIEWQEHYTPGRRTRIEVVAHSRQVTVYEITLTRRGVDAEGREYLGGMVGKNFRIFPRDKVLHMRDRVA